MWKEGFFFMIVVVMHFSNAYFYKSISFSTHSSNVLCSFFQLGVVLCRSGFTCLALGQEMVKVSRMLAMALLITLWPSLARISLEGLSNPSILFMWACKPCKLEINCLKAKFINHCVHKKLGEV